MESKVAAVTEPEHPHLRPTAELAERVLLPGDPERAMRLAHALLEEPRMFNHTRGLWGYTGRGPDGDPVTIQSTGMGGPSAAIVLSELIAMGVRRAVRVGTCGALSPELPLGELLVAERAICADGTSRALGAGEQAAADEGLTAALRARAPEAPAGTVVSVDLFYEDGPPGGGHEALAVEMEAATLFALGARRGIAVGCLLIVSDTFSPDGARNRIGDDELAAAAERMGAAAVGALSG